MSEDKPGAGVAGFSPPEPEHKAVVSHRWAVGIPGLERRHVSSIRVYWDDQPPPGIVEERLADIFKAMRLGFEQMEKGFVD